MGNIVINNVTFRVKKVLGDGNCFFRCMQDSDANKLNLHHESIRHLAVQEVGNNKAVYAQQLTNIQRRMEPIDDRCTRMLNSGQFVDSIEVSATSKTLNCDIIVYDVQQDALKPVIRGNDRNENTVQVYLMLSNSSSDSKCHFDLLEPISET